MGKEAVLDVQVLDGRAQGACMGRHQVINEICTMRKDTQHSATIPWSVRRFQGFVSMGLVCTVAVSSYQRGGDGGDEDVQDPPVQDQ